MRVDLSGLPDVAPGTGQLTGSDGRKYKRVSTKTASRNCDELIAAGAPVVLDFYGRGQFDWVDGSDAHLAWCDVRRYVLTREPTSKQLKKHEFWTAGIWESEDRHQLVYLVGHC